MAEFYMNSFKVDFDEKEFKAGRLVGGAISVLDDKTYRNEATGEAFRSMLDPYEIEMIFQVAKNCQIEESYIIDAGCLFGASTLAFAEALLHSEGTPPPHAIQSFDLFRMSPYYQNFSDGIGVTSPTQNAFPTFLNNIRGRLDSIAPHQGDFLQWHWPKENAISCIFNDLSKTIELNNHMMRQFARNLQVGGYFIQQDYVHFAEWWIAATMEIYADYFEEMGYFFGATKLFRMKKMLGSEIQDFDITSLSFQSLERALISAVERAPVTVDVVMKCALGMFYIDMGHPSKALEVVMPIRLREEEMEEYRAMKLQPHLDFHRVLPSNRRKVIEYARSDTKSPTKTLLL